MDKRKMLVKKCTKNVLQLLCEQFLEILHGVENEKKRIWVRSWLDRRNSHGVSNLLLKELAEEDTHEFTNCMRMDPTTFEILLNKVHQKIQRSNTIMREAIPARVKLQVTLSYLATGNNYRNLQQSFRVSRATILKFIPEVCDAIYEALGDFIKVPSTHEEWKVIEEGFNKRWNFPGCYGAIDGKHINIRAPANCGSYYFNYKGSNSVVLMAIVDDNYCFRYVNVGCNGRFSDGGVFQNCEISKALENNLLPNGGFIVGDDAFPLKPYLLKPYSRKQLTLSEKIFNYRLSRARRIVENAFGILVGKFRVFEKPIACDVSTVDKIILACCALHNWLRITNKNYFSRGLVDEENLDEYKIIEGSWRFQSHNYLLPISNAGSNHSSQIARLLREKYTAYFMNEGSVPWQERMIF